ncbi:MAG TPA: hypothetical protein QGF50_04030 [Roseibacillus sp.]|jgi:hypothetical protein|nr:hypothetical protein [Roseibacillus sp.]
MSRGAVANVKSGRFSVPIYYLPSVESYEAKWEEDGRERRIRNKDVDELKKRLRKVAKRLAGNSPAIESLTDDELAILQEIRRKGVTLADLETLQTVESVTVAEASKRLLEAKADTSTDNQRTLRTHLNQFGRKFGKRVISSITTTEIDAWLRKAAETSRTRRNKRSSLVTLWRWARDKGLLPQTLRTVAERTDFPSLRKQKRDLVIETWSPAELRTILKTVPPAYLPWVALSAFAGLRSLELFPGEKDPGNRKQVLVWEDIMLTGREPRIVVPAAVSKTAEKRTVPVSKQLAAWLRTVPSRKGPVCPVTVPWKGVKSRGGKSVIDLITDALGGPWKTNALRHSFGTYRVLQLDAVGKVALEMGNSERMVKSHYYDAGRKKAEAKRWFELGPDKVSRKLEVVA